MKRRGWKVKIGSTIIFGRWPQGEYGEVLPIERKVLKVEADRILLHSTCGLQVMPYTEKGGKVYWETSEIRNWLRTEFVKAFDDEEKEKICEVENIRGLTEDETECFKTKETIFLLSEDEIRKMCQDKTTWIRKPSVQSLKLGACADSDGNGVWWLRSYGRLEKLSMGVVRTDGGLYPGADVRADDVMVCPAVYIRR